MKMPSKTTICLILSMILNVLGGTGVVAPVVGATCPPAQSP